MSSRIRFIFALVATLVMGLGLTAGTAGAATDVARPAAEVAGSAPDGTLSLSTADPVVGRPITFRYSTSAAEVDPLNWVAVYDDPTKGPVDQVYGGGGSTMYQYVTNADGTVTFDTSKLTPGTKVAYFLAKDEYGWLATPVAFTLLATTSPTTDGTLSLSTPNLVVGDTATFTFQTTSAKVDPKNWVAIYDQPTTGPFGQTYVAASTTYQYVSTASGSVSFNTSKLTPGAKVAYFLYQDGYTWLARPVSFFLAPSSAPPVTQTDDGELSVVTANPTVDSTITLHYATDTPDPLNWVALYEDPDGGPVDQVYGGTGSTVYQYVPDTSGDVTISTANLTVGTHVAYFLYQDEYRWLAKPITFTLVAAPPPPPPPHFVTDDFTGTAVHTGGTFTQKLAGLWFDTTGGTTTFTKVSGDSWLNVSAGGIVTGKAPASVGDHPALITVQATDTAGHTGQIIVEAQAYDSASPGTLKTASWNLWDAGTHVDSSIEKDLSIILTNDLDVVGAQESGGTVAATLAQDLGWYSYQSGGDLGVLSRYPISAPTAPTASVPAAAVTITAGAQPVRVWTSHLDETAYGPEAACAGSTAAQLVTAEAPRLAQATAVLSAMKSDLSRSASVPVVLLADLASPSHLDWTAATKATHCGVGPVSWPVSCAVAAAGLQDTYRIAQPDPSTDPGDTWSPVVTTGADGKPEPQDRIDYVDRAGALLKVSESHALVTGFPAPVPDTADNSWTSDHAAAVTTFVIDVPKAATTTTLVSSRRAQVYAGPHPATLTAKVTAVGNAKATGIVEFRSGTTVLGSVATKNGIALYRASKLLPAGSAVLTAHFTGSATVRPSTSKPFTLTVIKGPTAVLLLPSARSQKRGTSRPVVLSAYVLALDRRSGAGVVQFRSNGKVLASVTAIKNVARYALPSNLPVGTVRVSATFVPTDRADVAGSSSGPVRITITH